MKINNVNFTGGMFIRGTQKQHEQIAKAMQNVLENAENKVPFLKIVQKKGETPVIFYSTGETTRLAKIFIPGDYHKYDEIIINPKSFGVQKRIRSAKTVLKAIQEDLFDFLNLSIKK